MTNSQFVALGAVVSRGRIQPELEKLLPKSSWQKAPDYSPVVVGRWLANSWSTEHVMRIQSELDDESKKFALHWLFPQAYYACFSQLMGLFSAVGYKDATHTSVIRRYGELLGQGKYPKCLTWYADGIPSSIKLVNVRTYDVPASYYVDLGDMRTVDNQIAQLLRSTRDMHLRSKREDLRKDFRTMRGGIKKRLLQQDWEVVSKKLGPTSLLSILYRKRIKANYRDIDTFVQSEIDGANVIENLVNLVDGLAIVHESFICRALGKKVYGQIVESAGFQFDFMQARRVLVEGMQ